MHLPTLALASLALALPVRADVLVADIDFGPDADVREIWQAVAMAQPGDTVLVRQGTYAAFEVAGALSIVGDGTGPVFTLGPVVIHDVPAGQSVLLRNIQLLYGEGSPAAAPLVIRDCDGPVVLDFCKVDWTDWSEPQTAVLVERSGAVTLTHCTIEGAQGLSIEDTLQSVTSPGSDALHVQDDAHVALLDCDLRGGDGGSDLQDTAQPGRDGGDALVVSGGAVLASGSSFLGGTGGSEQFASSPASQGGDGGSGIVVDGPADVQLHDVVVAAGEGGAVSAGTPGSPGAASSACCEVEIASLPGKTRSVFTLSPAVEGFDVGIALDGKPNESVLLLFSLQAGALPLTKYHGVLVATPAIAQLLVPSLGPGPHLNLHFIAPDLAGLQGLNLIVQGLFGPADATLSAPATITLLDAAF